MTTAAQQIVDTVGSFFYDPLGYVMFAFPWATEPSIQLVDWTSEATNESTGRKLSDEMAPYRARYDSRYGPDLWACQFLDELGDAIVASHGDVSEAAEAVLPADRVLRFSTASGHGIGKSVMVAFITKFIMDTRPRSKGTITANTADQLKTKTWAEIGKWHKLSITADMFTFNSGRGAMNLVTTDNDLRDQWRVDAQTCREENSEAFAGQHAASATSFYIFDEASNIPDKIFEVREGGLTDGHPMVFDFGNPTRNSGSFFENCAGRFKHRYNVREIDSRDVTITNKSLFSQWEEDYGTDSDFFKVRVRGMFPSAGDLQFIPTAMVKEAQSRVTVEDPGAPLLIGVDVARFGSNESVIYPRIGTDARSWPARRFQGLDTVQLTGKVIELVREFRALGKECSGLFVDGGGIGGAIVDQLRALGYNPIEVQFGGKATENMTYRFKSDEMWGRLKDALPKLCLPAMNERNGPDLFAGLTKREYGYTLTGNKLHLESKKDMGERLGSDLMLDLPDALALTFAEEVFVRMPADIGAALTATSEYDPLMDRPQLGM